MKVTKWLSINVLFLYNEYRLHFGKLSIITSVFRSLPRLKFMRITPLMFFVISRLDMYFLTKWSESFSFLGSRRVGRWQRYYPARAPKRALDLWSRLWDEFSASVGTHSPVTSLLLFKEQRLKLDMDLYFNKIFYLHPFLCKYECVYDTRFLRRKWRHIRVIRLGQDDYRSSQSMQFHALFPALSQVLLIFNIPRN